MDSSPIALAFQFAAASEMQRVNDREWRVSRSGKELALVFSDGLGEARLIVGRDYPANGWASPAYRLRVAAPQLILDYSGEDRLTGVGLFEGDRTQAKSIGCAQPSDGARCFRIEFDEYCDYILLNAGSVGDAITAWGVTFHGRAVWLRVSKRDGARIRWLDGLSCVAPALGVKVEYNETQEELCL